MTNGTFSFRTDILTNRPAITIPSSTRNLNVPVPDAPDVPGAPNVPELLLSPVELVWVQSAKAMQNAAGSTITRVSPQQVPNSLEVTQAGEKK